MKNLFLIMILFLGMSLTTLEAQDRSKATSIAPITSTEVAMIRSNTVVTGTVVVTNGKFPSSAIINDRIVWEGQIVTVANNGKTIITPRDRREQLAKAPSLRLVQVKNGKVVLEYTRDGLKLQTYKKSIKSRTKK